ncbi:FAD-binding domain-containing protein [Agrocybe pediades]|nr:FAD-binding domain-containing protein [Agrocybe pediades]
MPNNQLPVIKGDVLTPDSAGYKQAIARWAANAERDASIVAFVKDGEDIVKCLKFAKEHGMPIAVRCGGHSAGGASSVDGGLVIDLSRYLNTATVDPVKKLAYIGGGALWETVDKAAIKHGLATVGGTVNHTGVGGLILGGGYGWLSGQYGLSIDNLVTIVTADGSVLTANETENSDLFFAVRGGGGNFGIVTEFVSKLHPQRPTVYAGHIIFLPSKIEQVVAATNKWLQNIKENEAMFQVSTVGGPEGKPIFVLVVFYNGSEAEGRENFKWVFDIGPIADTTKEIPYEQLNALQNGMTGHGKGVYQKGSVINRPSPSVVAKAHDKFAEIVQSHQLGGQVIYEYVSLKKINSVPVDATAFPRGLEANVLINISWDNTVRDASKEGRKYATKLTDILRGEVVDSHVPGYSNYDDSATAAIAEDKAKIAFRTNYPKLQGIKKKYDPENIFNKWFPITPA